MTPDYRKLLFAAPLATTLTLAASAQDCIVRLKDGETITPIAANTNSVVLRALADGHTYLVESAAALPPQAVAGWVNSLASDDGVVFAEIDRDGTINDGEVCDPDNGGSNDFQCTIGFVDGDPTLGEYTEQTWIDALHIPEARNAAPDFETIVAVIDTGIDPAHSAFAGKLASNGWDFVLDQAGAYEVADGVDDDGDGAADEAFGHGTAVAGAVVLVNPMARILPLRVADADGTTKAFRVAEAIEYAIAQGATVINLSLSFDSEPQSVAWAAHHAVSQGISVFTSAGNTGAAVLFPGNLSAKARTQPRVPAIYPHGVVSIAAVDSSDVLALFSAFGEEIDLSAPGVSIYSAYPGEQWATWNGTSMACGVASGVASLVQACAPPSTSSAEVMIQTARSIDDENPGYEGAVGWGVPDALAAVLEALFQQ